MDVNQSYQNYLTNSDGLDYKQILTAIISNYVEECFSWRDRDCSFTERSERYHKEVIDERG